MAELGTAASIIAVGSIAIQVGDSALKLKNFWNDVKDAPEDITSLIEETRLLSLLLSGDVANGLPNTRSDIATKCLESCREAASMLRLTVTELGAGMNRRKRIGKFKAVLKKGSVEKLKERLGRAQMMLLISRQFYTEVMQEHHHRLQQELQERSLRNLHNHMCQTKELVSLIRTVHTDISSSPNEPLPGSRAPSITFDRQANDQQLAGNSYSLKRSYAKQKKILARFQGPRWFSLTSRAIEISTKSPAGWNFSIRMYNIVALDAPVFQFAKNGDIPGLQRLFEEGKASPFDVSDIGESLLNDHSRSRFRYAFTYYMNHQDIELACLLAAASDFDKHSMSEKLEALSFGNPGISQWSLLTHKFNLSPLDLSASEIVNCFTRLWISKAILDIIQYLLAGRPVEPELFTVSSPTGDTFVHAIARGTYAISSVGPPMEVRLQERLPVTSTRVPGSDHSISFMQFAEFVKLVVSGGSDLHGLCHIYRHICQDCGGCHTYSMTPFIVVYNLIPTAHQAGEVVRTWLYALQHAKVDLLAYGQREMEVHLAQQITKRLYFSRGQYLVSFTYGPEPSDWELFFVAEDTIGTKVLDFWDMVEHPERSLPGAWIEERYPSRNRGEFPIVDVKECSAVFDDFWWP